MKEFGAWNEVKNKINEEESRLYTTREVWWCRLGVNVGTEQDGSGAEFARPCVILRGFGREACLVVPLTTSNREHPLRIAVGAVDGEQARANISQIRIIDTRRLVRKVGFLPKERFKTLRDAIRRLV